MSKKSQKPPVQTVFRVEAFRKPGVLGLKGFKGVRVLDMMVLNVLPKGQTFSPTERADFGPVLAGA